MTWRSITLGGGLLLVAWLGWQLTPYLQSLAVMQQTTEGPKLLATGWGLLREPSLWPLIGVGMLMGWFIGHLEGLWSGSLAAKVDWQTAQQTLHDEYSAKTRQIDQKQQNITQAWSEVKQAQEIASQASLEAKTAKDEISATQFQWEQWARQEVEKARAETAEAQRRSRNAVATAERRKRQIDRLKSERSHPA